MTAAIAVQQLHKHFGQVHALRGVDLEIRPGEFFGLLGPNGAGKSTLINILAGLIRPDAGFAAVLGHDVQRDAVAVRRAIGVVPQEPGSTSCCGRWAWRTRPTPICATCPAA